MDSYGKTMKGPFIVPTYNNWNAVNTVVNGSLVYVNSENKVFHGQNNTWLPVGQHTLLATANYSSVTTSINATGGNITTYNTYRMHSFNASGNFVCSNSGNVEVFVVGGGGAGSASVSSGGAGGGGGGVIIHPSYAVSGTVTVVVGGGGTNSEFGNLVAYRGGAGGTCANAWNYVNNTTPGLPGGCGGGGGGIPTNSMCSPGGAGQQANQPGDSGLYGYGANGEPGYGDDNGFYKGGRGGTPAKSWSPNITPKGIYSGAGQGISSAAALYGGGSSYNNGEPNTGGGGGSGSDTIKEGGSGWVGVKYPINIAENYTANYTPTVNSLFNDLTLSFVPQNINVRENPMFSPDSLTPKPIKTMSGNNLPPNALIPGNQYTIKYDLNNNQWKLTHTFRTQISDENSAIHAYPTEQRKVSHIINDDMINIRVSTGNAGTLRIQNECVISRNATIGNITFNNNNSVITTTSGYIETTYFR